MSNHFFFLMPNHSIQNKVPIHKNVHCADRVGADKQGTLLIPKGFKKKKFIYRSKICNVSMDLYVSTT